MYLNSFTEQTLRISLIQKRYKPRTHQAPSIVFSEGGGWQPHPKNLKKVREEKKVNNRNHRNPVTCTLCYFNFTVDCLIFTSIYYKSRGGATPPPPWPPDAKTKFEIKKKPKYPKQNNNKETKTNLVKLNTPPPPKKTLF